MKPFIVEFLGTQGSGKTTLLPTVISFLRENGINAYTPTEAARPFASRTLVGKLIGNVAPPSIRRLLLWQVYYRTSMLLRLSFNRRNRRLVNFVRTTQKARPPGAGVRERRVLFWFSHLCGTYTFLSGYARENEALVSDDGFVHRTVHFNASPIENPEPTNITRYLDLIPLPDLLIVPRVPLEICLARVMSRGIWDHFRGKTQDDLRRYLASSENVVDIVVDALCKKGPLIIEVDNSDSYAQTGAADLQNKLKTIQVRSHASLLAGIDSA